MKNCLIFIPLIALIAGCSKESGQPIQRRADLVPLKIVMTDYIFADGGEKIIKIQGSAQMIVPLGSFEPSLKKNKYVYTNLPQPKVDDQSVVIDKQELLLNERGFFTTRAADSEKINAIRKKAAEEMKKTAGSEAHVQRAKVITEEVLRAFHKMFGYECQITWKSDNQGQK